jgi:hypothetical protein
MAYRWKLRRLRQPTLHQVIRLDEEIHTLKVPV